MVTPCNILAAVLADVPVPRPVDDVSLVKMKAAIAALIILGVAMVLLTWLGARVTRRYMKGSSFHTPTPRPEQSDWSPQPLSPDDELDP